jgi:hypothetical protein
MLIATAITQWIIRLTGVTQVVLGVFFWNRRALELIHLHMMIGMVFVIALLVTTGLAARAGLKPVRVLLAAAYAVAIPVFGYIHPRLLPGSEHWIIQVLHLTVGLAAMVMAARLAAYIGDRRRGGAEAEPRRALPPRGLPGH